MSWLTSIVHIATTVTLVLFYVNAEKRCRKWKALFNMSQRHIEIAESAIRYHEARATPMESEDRKN